MSNSNDDFNLAELASSLSSACSRLVARSRVAVGGSPSSHLDGMFPPLPPGPPPASSSPPAGASSAVGSGVGLGTSGEFSICSGGSSGNLPIFVLTPKFQSQLCLGVVNHGTKFCLQGKTSCSCSSHARKTTTVLNHIYIISASKTAFTHHSLDAVFLTQSQLSSFLQELHPVDEWIRLFRQAQQAHSQPVVTIQSIAMPVKPHGHVPLIASDFSFDDDFEEITLSMASSDPVDLAQDPAFLFQVFG